MSRQSGGATDHRQVADVYMPQWSHVSSGVVLHEDGARVAMARVRGVPHELCDAAQRNEAADLLNRIWRDIGDDNVTLCIHFVREKAPDHFVMPRFRNEFSARLYRAYYESCIRGKLFVNDWYITLIVSPRGVPLGTGKFRRWTARALYQLRLKEDRHYADTSEIEGLWIQLSRSLAAYDVTRLGYRYNQTPYHRYRFTEIGEAVARFLGVNKRVPVTTGKLGDDIYTDGDQPIFEPRIYRILPPGCEDHSDDAEGVRWGQLFGLVNYMDETGPDLFDAVLSLDMSLVVSHHFCFTAVPDAVGHLVRTAKQMKSTKDAGRKERKGLRKAASQAQSREEARGEHDVSIAVYAGSYRELLTNAAKARATLVTTGAQIVPETGANMAQFFGQVPGNFRYCAHPGKIGSRDLVNFANFGAFPSGAQEGKWGPAMLPFATTALTRYDFVPHVEDVGMMAIFGRTGKGKSVLMRTLMAMVDQHMVDDAGLILLFDNGGGGRILIESIGGNYLSIDYGEPSGLMPLKGFPEDTPYARTCLTRLVRFMVQQDQLGPIPPADNARIEDGVAAMLDLPVEMRSFWRLRQFLGWDDPMGAGPRLERWCWGQSLGWLFDGSEDLVNFELPAAAFDPARLFDDPEVLAPAVMYLMDRIYPIVGTRRIAGFFDEADKTVVSPYLEGRMGDFWRRWRQKDAFAVAATQQPEDFLKTATGRAVLDQCPSMMFLQTSDPDEIVYCGNENTKGMGFTQGEFNALSRLGPREVLLKRRGEKAESVIFNFDLSGLDPWFLDALSGTSAGLRRWNELRDKFPNAREAFDKLANQIME